MSHLPHLLSRRPPALALIGLLLLRRQCRARNDTKISLIYRRSPDGSETRDAGLVNGKQLGFKGQDNRAATAAHTPSCPSMKSAAWAPAQISSAIPHVALHSDAQLLAYSHAHHSPIYRTIKSCFMATKRHRLSFAFTSGLPRYCSSDSRLIVELPPKHDASVV